MNLAKMFQRKIGQVAILLALLLLPLMPVSADNYTPFFPIFSVAAASCDAGFDFQAAAVNSYAQVLGFRFFVDSGGLRYTDQIIVNEVSYPVLNIVGALSVGITNEGGTANAAWPIPSGQEVYVTVQALLDNAYPVSETRATLNSCDGNVIASESGAIGHLVNNISFEEAGTLPALPAKWEAIVDDDERICNSDVIDAAHSGLCAFNMKPGAVKNKLYQDSPLDSIARNGDQVRMGAWVKASNLGTGSSLMLKIKFPTLDKIKQKIELPVGSYAYQFVSTDPVSIIEAPTKITVTIQAKGAGGSFVIDDVMADVAVGAAPAPIVRFASTSGIIALPGGTQATASISGIDLTRPLR
ncbi:MAG: hypothetical protein H7X77_02225 [Anaerolineae bacterium]|nr:hypothetical protein [Anaerolineae bacterium]